MTFERRRPWRRWGSCADLIDLLVCVLHRRRQPALLGIRQVQPVANRLDPVPTTSTSSALRDATPFGQISSVRSATECGRFAACPGPADLDRWAGPGMPPLHRSKVAPWHRPTSLDRVQDPGGSVGKRNLNSDIEISGIRRSHVRVWRLLRQRPESTRTRQLAGLDSAARRGSEVYSGGLDPLIQIRSSSATSSSLRPSVDHPPDTTFLVVGYTERPSGPCASPVARWSAPVAVAVPAPTNPLAKIS